MERLSYDDSTCLNCPAGNALVLAIDKIHADRIFSGEKRFELRKKLPSTEFDTVYLYENGNGGIVGAFEVGEVIRAEVEDLWEFVGEEATTRKRFFEYFGRWRTGCAIAVKNPKRFEPILQVAEIRQRVNAFSAPQSYLLLKEESRLLSILKARHAQSRSDCRIHLRAIKKSEEKEFIRLVTREIGGKYEGITTGFAESLLNTHRIGCDPRGILTTAKEVLTVCDHDDSCLGFTTLTYKVGGCVKTGPTVLLARERGKGLGSEIRQKLVEHAIDKGVRKLYCTCPDNDEVVLRYLLKASFIIEAHLADHYHIGHGEFVLGAFVNCPGKPSREIPSNSHEQCSVVEASAFNKRSFQSAALRHARRMIPDMTHDQMKKIIDRSVSSVEVPLEEKPLNMLGLKRGENCKGIVILIPKRGGAVKGLVLSETSNEATLKNVLAAAEEFVRSTGNRKLYFLVAVFEVGIAQFLRMNDYLGEGLLREPYCQGEDVLVLSKFVETR